jgi:di/tricarboxylate transporter
LFKRIKKEGKKMDDATFIFIGFVIISILLVVTTLILLYNVMYKNKKNTIYHKKAIEEDYKRMKKWNQKKE